MLQTTEKTDVGQDDGTSMRAKLLHIAKEPLLHFVIIGAAIYLAYDLFGQSEGETELRGENTIVVTQGELNSLAEIWQQQWKRPPTPREMKGLVDQYVRETVLYREALAMGLDKDDTIVRRRLAQKLEFLCQDLIQPELADDQQLQAWFDKNTGRYQAPDVITLTHVFLDPDRRGEQTLSDARKLKGELADSSQAPDADLVAGDPFMLQRYYPERSEFDLSKLFGREFARSVMELESGQWHGPVLSGYGVHLVYVHDHQQSPSPEYDQVAERVRADWEEEKRSELNDQYVAGLLERYEVVIESDETASWANLDSDSEATDG